MYQPYNPNPLGKNTSDCVVRAISKITGQSWDDVYLGVMACGFELKEMPSTNAVWREYLKRLGFCRTAIPDECPDCYTIKEFCGDHQSGSYLLATGTHVVAVVDGDYYDTWDSGDKIPIYYWRREK